MNWNAFRRAAPGLAEKAEELFDRTGVILLGTIRKDGSPRISPVEPLIVDGDLYLGMMWQSLKALDLLRDPRCTIHTTISDRMAPEGELKIHGRAQNVSDPGKRRRYCEELEKKIGWAPTEPKWHLFALADIQSVGFFRNEETERTVTRFRAGEGVSEFRQKP